MSKSQNGAQAGRQPQAAPFFGAAQQRVRQPVGQPEREHQEAPPIVHEVLRAPGRSLDHTARRLLESHFTRTFGPVSPAPALPILARSALQIGPSGDQYERAARRTAATVGQMAATSAEAKESGADRFDFSRVQVHDGSTAARSAQAVGARAYTVGQHIVFGAGQYAPQTPTGQRLLAHELTHVVQQSGGVPGLAPRQPGVLQREDEKDKVPAIAPSYNIRYEGIHEKAARLIQEMKEHINAGDIDKAKSLVPEIKQWVSYPVTTRVYAIPAAELMLSIGLTKDAFEVLETARKDQVISIGSRFSHDIMDALLKAARAALADKKPEIAYETFVEMLRWLEKPEFQHKSMFSLQDPGYFRQQTYKEVVAGLGGVIDFHLVQAEEAYQKNDPNAATHLEGAKKMLARMKKDLADRPGIQVIVAEPKLTKPGSETAVYTDASNPKVKAKVKNYPNATWANHFSNRIRRLETILESKSKQISAVHGFYVGDIYTDDNEEINELYEKKYKKRPNIHELGDRRKFWELKYDYLLGEGMDRPKALGQIIANIRLYLEAFSIHSKYDIPDTRTDILTAEFPKASTRQALMDCGVFAMRTAYELSLIRTKANLDFYYVFMPIHVGLGIIDQGQDFGWALHNNQISEVDKEKLVNKGVGFAVGSFFGYAPTPMDAVKLNKLTGKALRKALISHPDKLFRPLNFSKLRGKAKKEAIAKGKELRKEYFSLQERHRDLSRESTFHMIFLRDTHKEIGKKKPEAYKKKAVDRIGHLYGTYERMTKRMRKFYNDLVELRGDKNRVNTNISPYYTNAFYLLRYLAHQLGQTDIAEKEFVKKPDIAFTPDELKYKGEPPPWDKGVFDFAED